MSTTFLKKYKKVVHKEKQKCYTFITGKYKGVEGNE
jgi:hypothetical protein